MGCTQKAGSAPVRGVLAYGEPVKEKGLNLLSAPGNDLVAATALAAAGAQLVLFTTGRGTSLGAAVPTVKISSNTALYNRKINWIDFNAGDILNGEDINALADDLFELIVETANGKKTKNEINNYRDISIFKDGVIM